ncbi:EAL domain-containing protein [Geobacter sp. DSM 9736]|uniref:sensor domain-containing protein n=1 Tax=Geobacter sp. DSM 9736 TaxID=1277350 RepID=UPI000B5F3254|nr:EAL domain-containing protein [Geobacter sp. DSM 9736]SNB44900.1 diguanylate cyclase/phosphodiesterase with PAS/PAC sensor(s) [Geobacter sp. DSM 9736]
MSPSHEPQSSAASFPTPVRMFIQVVVVLFFLEMLVMFLLPYLQLKSEGAAENFADSVLLTILSAPLLWHLIVRPLRGIALMEMTRADTVLENMVDGVVVFDTTGVIESVNAAFLAIFQCRADEMIGRKMDSFVHLQENAARLDDAASDTERQMIWTRADGSTVEVDISVSTFSSEGMVRTVAIVRDITERNRERRHLHETNQQLHALVQASPLAIVALDASGMVTTWNRAAEHIFGWSSEEVIGAPFPACDEEMRIEHGRVREQVMTGRPFTNLELQRLRKDGRVIDVSVSAAPLFDTSGGITGIMSIIADITSRKRSETDLRLFKRAIKATDNGITIVDVSTQERRIIYVNPAVPKITGYQADEVVGKDLGFLCAGERDGATFARIEAALKENGEGRFLFRNRRKDGSFFWNELFLGPVRDEKGRVGHYIAVMNDVSERKRFEEQLVYLANHDALTGLPNRNLFMDRLGQVLAYNARTDRQACVMFLDLDHFKVINDTLGHPCGDKLLQTVARLISGCLRTGDTVARLGGDEFTVILPNIAGSHEIVAVAEKILEIIAHPVELDGTELFVTASIGITLFPADGSTVDLLLKNADTAMYHAKEQGRNNYQFFSEEMNRLVFERMFMETNLRRALDRQELLLHYQPQLDLSTGEVIGMEALVRWQHPELGLIPPVRFIPLAEECGLITQLGEWVLRTACRQNRQWQEEGLSPLKVAVNISARQFRQHNLVDLVARVLEETGLEPGFLELELTESIIMKDLEQTVRTLRDLEAMGISLAIDDFGTGYSSLSYLQRFPINTLKIDQSFIRDLSTNPDDNAIVQTIIVMAHQLGMKVTAEGVETEEQLAFLCNHSCEKMQGYYFSKPLPADAFALLLRERKKLPLGQP